ncbi:hypothetical protein [Aeromonas veronii]|uniref:hypothetical protein n=1 Tax=Aeromonas veronii TaxID=654 RepID=UPI00196B620A|nr:hypothetical protein [Aeromonas veronii]
MEVTVPPGSSGSWCIEEFTISEAQSYSSCLRAIASGRVDAFIPEGTYKRLKRGATVVMSNSPMEVRTNRTFIRRAKGHVLINGLGLGMVLSEILKKPDVKSVTVIEASFDVIKLVAPTFVDEPRVNIIHADAFKYQPAEDACFDAVWHDIWDAISSENLPEMHCLHQKYKRIAKWQSSWARKECEIMRKHTTKSIEKIRHERLVYAANHDCKNDNEGELGDGKKHCG